MDLHRSLHDRCRRPSRSSHRNSGSTRSAGTCRTIAAAAYELLDHYLGAAKRDWVTAFAGFFEKRNADAVAALQASRKERPATKPSLALARYAGKYADSWYGPIEIREQEGALRIAFLQTPTMVGPLEHWAYDTFIARWTDGTIEPAYVTFALDPDGKPARITMKAVSPVADFSFDYHHLLFTPLAEPEAGG